jgi:hypothetical protein
MVLAILIIAMLIVISILVYFWLFVAEVSIVIRLAATWWVTSLCHRIFSFVLALGRF